MSRSLTTVLVAINVAVYIWLVLTGGLESTAALLRHGAMFGPDVQAGQWWRLVTYAFLHGGVMHITFNMIALYQVGIYVEVLFGAVRMGAVYVVSLLGAGIAIEIFSFNSVTVGASGAIFGLFGALVAIGVRLGERGRQLIVQTLPIILINLAIGYAMPNISNVGHVGGLVCGFISGLALFATPRRIAMARAAAAVEGRVSDERESVLDPARSSSSSTPGSDATAPTGDEPPPSPVAHPSASLPPPAPRLEGERERSDHDQQSEQPPGPADALVSPAERDSCHLDIRRGGGTFKA